MLLARNESFVKRTIRVGLRAIDQPAALLARQALGNGPFDILAVYILECVTSHDVAKIIELLSGCTAAVVTVILIALCRARGRRRLRLLCCLLLVYRSWWRRGDGRERYVLAVVLVEAFLGVRSVGIGIRRVHCRNHEYLQESSFVAHGHSFVAGFICRIHRLPHRF